MIFSPPLLFVWGRFKSILMSSLKVMWQFHFMFFCEVYTTGDYLDLFFQFPLSLGDAWGLNGKWLTGAAGISWFFLGYEKAVSERYPYYE